MKMSVCVCLLIFFSLDLIRKDAIATIATDTKVFTLQY